MLLRQMLIWGLVLSVLLMLEFRVCRHTHRHRAASDGVLDG